MNLAFVQGDEMDLIESISKDYLIIIDTERLEYIRWTLRDHGVSAPQRMDIILEYWRHLNLAKIHSINS